MSCKCIQINRGINSELGQQLINPLTSEERKEMIYEIEDSMKVGTLKSMDWNKLNDEDLVNLHLFATVKCGIHQDMSLLGENKEIHRITKNMEDQILKNGFEGEDKITIGSYVKYSRNWLQSSGIYTGNLPRGIGKVINIQPLGKDTKLAVIQWNYKDIPDKVNIKNLILASKIENV